MNEAEIQNKKVSIIIPTYKRSDYLLRAVDSVLKQTYENIEIIIVDDNVPDSDNRLKTKSKLEKYKNCEKIVYLENERNLGGALARNQGILISTGDYITFLDDDDIYLPQKVEKQVQYMEENELNLSFTDVKIFNAKNKLIDYREHSYVNSFDNEELLKNHLMHHLTPTATYMFDRETINLLGGFSNVKMGQEFMLMLKTIEDGYKIGYLPSSDVIQYIHDGERISVGKNKLDKEIEMFNFKKQYFNILNSREKRYIRFRHYAVMSIAGKRSNEWLIVFKYLFMAVLTTPLEIAKEVIIHLRKLKKYKVSQN